MGISRSSSYALLSAAGHPPSPLDGYNLAYPTMDEYNFRVLSKPTGGSGAALSAGLALTFSLLSHYFTTQRSELWSEALSWILLPVLFSSEKNLIATGSSWVPRSAIGNGDHNSSRLLWLVALCIAIASFSKAEFGLSCLFPLVTPFLLVAQRLLRPELVPTPFPISTTKPTASLASPLIADNIWGALAVSLLSVGTLSRGSAWALVPSIAPMVALLIVYISFLPKSSKSHQLIPHVNWTDGHLPLAARTILALVIAIIAQTYWLGLTFDNIDLIICVGIFKSLTWGFMIQTSRYASWIANSTIGTFGLLASADPFRQVSEVLARFHILGSVLCITQLLHYLRKQNKVSRSLRGFMLLPIIPYLANLYVIKLSESSFPVSYLRSQQHPIELLIEQGQMEFRTLMGKQSTSFDQAKEEYIKRYGIEPPPGFQGWYDYATQRGSAIIDDFDIIFEKISPFFILSGEEVQAALKKMRGFEGKEFWHCGFPPENSTEISCAHSFRTNDRHVSSMFTQLVGQLPEIPRDLEFLVNHFDEPTLLLKNPTRDLQHTAEVRFSFQTLSHQSTWDAVTQSCGTEARSQKVWLPEADLTQGLPFISDRKSSMNLCPHPEYRNLHGLFNGPTTLKLIEGLVPILSTGSISTFGDILFPSPAYLEEKFRYEEKADMDWDQKQNKLYWTGSSTGGYVSDESWRHFHRQRFVEYAQNLNSRPYYYTREFSNQDRIGLERSSFLNSRLYDVAFTKIFQCDAPLCRKQRAVFKPRSWADKDEAMKSKLVFDLDGNGISGRFYKLLASNSAVLKQTIFREWHDERLVPWVHYIPVSLSLQELPELVLYLTSTEKGQQRAQEIAAQGRDWYFRALREVDMGVYIYRLLLELARLQDPQRPALHIPAR